MFLYVVCNWLFVGGCAVVLFVVGCLLSVACCLLCVVRCVLWIGCCVLCNV